MQGLLEKFEMLAWDYYWQDSTKISEKNYSESFFYFELHNDVADLLIR